MYTNRLSPLRVCRMFQKKSLYIIGDKTKIDPSKLSLIERGLKQPSREEKRRLAKALRASIKDLFPPQEANRAN